MGAYFSNWQGIMQEMLLGGDHLRQSTKSLIANLRQKKEPVPAHLLMGSEIEFSVSGAGLVALLLHWHVRRHSIRKMKKVAGSPADSAAKRLLMSLVRCIFGQTSVAWKCAEGFTIVVEHGVVDLELLKTSQGKGHGRIGRTCGDSCMGTFLIDMLQHARLSSHTARDRSRHYSCLATCLHKFGFMLELAARETCGDSCNHLCLGVLRGAKGHRRIPGGFKRAVLHETINARNCRRPAQLLAGLEVATKKARRGDSCVRSSTGDTFEHFLGYQYFLACRELFAKERVISVALDGTRVSGGQDSVSFAAWSASEEKGCWLPTQVHRSKKASINLKFGMPFFEF